MKALQIVGLTLVVLLLLAGPVLAQGEGPHTPVFSGGAIGAGLGAALTLVGAGYGLGRIGHRGRLSARPRQQVVAHRARSRY